MRKKRGTLGRIWFRKQKERRRKIEDKIEKENDSESGSSSRNNGNMLYTKWRNKYYRDVNCLQVNVAALTQKNFGVCLSTLEESEVESDEDMEQINATTQTSISYCKSPTIDTAKIIYDSLSPPTKKKTRFALTICDNKPDGFDRQIRRDVGVNISKEMSIKI